MLLLCIQILYYLETITAVYNPQVDIPGIIMNRFSGEVIVNNTAV